MNQKTAEILCIGTELLMGDIVNTNAAYISKELANIGVNIYHQTVVGDNPERLKDALSLAFSRADIVITTGGLGPTYDDLSKETIAAYFGRELVLDQYSLEKIETFFEKIGREMTVNNRKQAFMPKDCIIFPNPNGTAPGCAIMDEPRNQDEPFSKMAIMLPGPPREMKPMFDNSVKPLLMQISNTKLVSTNLHFFGIGESSLESMLHDYMTSTTNPTIAPYAKTGEVMLRITARVPLDGDSLAANLLLQPAIEKAKQVAGDYLYGVNIGDLQTAAILALKTHNLHVATAESCTGGYVSKRLTDVEGSSAVFECGICSYSNRVKECLLGVSAETLNKFGAVSKEVAAEMAQSIRRISGAEIGISVTGNAGPQASEGKNVGTVFVAVDSDYYKEVLPLSILRQDDDSREYIRYLASSHALHLILKAVKAFKNV